MNEMSKNYELSLITNLPVGDYANTRKKVIAKASLVQKICEIIDNYDYTKILSDIIVLKEGEELYTPILANKELGLLEDYLSDYRDIYELLKNYPKSNELVKMVQSKKPKTK